MVRTKYPDTKKKIQREILLNPQAVARTMCLKSFYFFFLTFWPEISNDALKNNWHIKYICDELQKVADRVGNNEPKLYDLIINIPPGSSKTSIISIAFPAWCWTKWHWMRFITAGYSKDLSLEAAEYSRDLIRSDRFKMLFPELQVKDDKDTKSNFRVEKHVVYSPGHLPRKLKGGNRYSTSVGGTLTGYHGHILIVDDPLNPNQATSKVKLQTANDWCDRTLSTRKTDKKVSVTIFVMQRLHQDDPTGHLLKKRAGKIKHVCMPAEIKNYKDKVCPKELLLHYQNDLLDPDRMDWPTLQTAESELGQYEFAGQMGQDPTPPGGGMFKVDNFRIIQTLPHPDEIDSVARYWDKAGSADTGAYTVGLKMIKLKNNQLIIADVVRGQWSAETRERILRQTAESDRLQNLRLNNKETSYYIEQEPGSGGKESADATVRNMLGFNIYKDLPKGDKVYRADPFSVQVNNGNVMLLQGIWNSELIEEYRFFPFSKYKDQVDAGSGSFSKLVGKKKAKIY